jgi:hypothetical protein
MPLKEKHWNWIKISIYIVAGIFVCGILKLILQIFNGTGPISTGVGKVLGAGANLINGVVNGCSKQPDCSKGSNTDKNSCENLTNCSFETTTSLPTPGATGTTTNACISSNGVAPGGGINTMGCALGIGFLAWLAASLLAPIAGFFIKLFGMKNKTVQNMAEVSGKPYHELWQEVGRKSFEEAAKANNEYQDRFDEPPPVHIKEMMAKITAARVVFEQFNVLLADMPDNTKSLADAQARYAKEVASAIEEAKHTDDTDGNKDGNKDADEIREAVTIAKGE